MRRLALCALVVGGLALAACHKDDPTVETPKPLDKMSKEEWCAFYSNYLKRPELTAEVREKDLAAMRQRGCGAS
jgi:nitrous oxide reductase accessory protein NosL